MVEAKTATTRPTVIDEMYGVRNLGCTLLNISGSSPSFDIEKNTRLWPSNMTTIVLVSPPSAPIFTSSDPHFTPVASMPTARESGTFRYL